MSPHNRTALALFLLALLALPAFAQTSVTGNITQTQDTGGILAGSALKGWVTDWRVIATLAITISIVLVSLAYAVSIGFGLNELKAWAQVELVQVFGSALLVVFLIAFLSAMDPLVDTIAQDASAGACSALQPGTPCSIIVAQKYIDQVTVLAKDKATSILENNIRSYEIASTRVGIQFNTMYVLWAGGNWASGSGGDGIAEMMKVDRNNTLLSHLANIISSLRAQRAFLDVIALTLGPVLLLFGIIGRTFFFTRKLGGLLIASGISLMFVFPLMYVFSWYTLSVSVHSDQGYMGDEACPEVCLKAPPNQTAAIADCNASCSITNAGVTTTCPTECREIPFPSWNPSCAAPGIEAACMGCPKDCKVIRTRYDCGSDCPADLCPTACKTKLPVEDANCAECIGCPSFCRTIVADRHLSELQAECKLAACYACAAYPECNTIVPAAAQGCDVACDGCPEQCRINLPKQCSYTQDACTSDSDCTVYTCNSGTCSYGSGTSCTTDADCNKCNEVDTSGWFTAECLTSNNALACSKCPDDCKVTPPETLPCASATPITSLENCVACPMGCRWEPNADLSVNSRTTYPAPEDQFITTENCESWDASGYPADLADYFRERGCIITDFDTVDVASGTYIRDNPCSVENCSSACRSEYPKICYDYNPAETDPEKINLCAKCPTNCRMNVSYGGIEYAMPGCDDPSYLCDEAHCPGQCYQATSAIPETAYCQEYESDSYNAATKTYNYPYNETKQSCTACPYNCRVSGAMAPSDASCNAPLATNITISTASTFCSLSACKTAKSCSNYTCCTSFTIGQCSQDTAWKASAGDFNCPAPASVCSSGNPAGPSVTIGAGCPVAPDGYVYVNTTQEMTGKTCKKFAFKCYRNVCRAGTVCDKVGCTEQCKKNAPWVTSCMPYQGALTDELICSLTPPTANVRALDRTSCKQCPITCRISGDSTNCYLPSTEVECSNDYFCNSFCKTSAPPINENCLEFKPLPCQSCPLACRMLYPDEVVPPQSCTDNPNCDDDLCTPYVCKPELPGGSCENCTQCEEDCTRQLQAGQGVPEVSTYTNCAELCKPAEGAVTFGMTDLAAGSGATTSSQYGGADVQAVGVLLVPAFILPLFNIMATLAFVRALSPVLGGDYDIPGISRLL